MQRTNNRRSPNGASQRARRPPELLALPPHIPHFQLTLLRNSQDDLLTIRAQNAARDIFLCRGELRDLPQAGVRMHHDRIGDARGDGVVHVRRAEVRLAERVEVVLRGWRGRRALARAVRA